MAYGCDEHLVACLHALTPHLLVTVVDNSQDAGVAALSRNCCATYVDPGRNLGFAAGVNLGVRHVRPDADVLVVNPDALVTTEMVAALALLRGARVAAVSPLLAGLDGTPQRVRWPFPSPARAWRQALLGGDGGGSGEGFLVGAVLLLSRAALEQLGGFDERFFLYAEETDWQRRAHLAGWQLVLCEHVTAVHVGGGTSSDETRRMALFHAGTETYVRKWYGPSGWQVFRAATITSALLRTLFRRRDRRESLARARVYLAGPRRVAGVR